MKHSLKWFFIGLVVGLVCGLPLGWWLCSREQTVSRSTYVDTVRYYKPIPHKQSSDYHISLPQIIFAPADTIAKVVVVTEKGDSVNASFKVERREYRDSTYRAIISGAVVGDRRPTLDYIETYERTTIETTVLKPYKLLPYANVSVGVYGDWAIGAGAGVIIKEQHLVGVEYQRMGDKNSLQLRYGYIFKPKK